MANTVNSTNMAMPVPVVGVDPGPQYATDINTCLGIIDSHDHTSGNGVKITPNGLNISSDLTFNSTASATNLYKAAFTSQSSALTGTNFLSFIGGNLYVNDGSGNQIPITSGGGVAGSPGSIGSLSSPAAATYSAGSKLFTWTADSLKAAAMDNGAVTIRETNVASAKGITIKSPTSLGSDYSLTLPTGLPGSAQYLSCDASGNLSNVSADTIGSAMSSSAPANNIASLRTRPTGTSVSAGGVAISAAVTSYTNATTSYTDVASVTITTSGRPVQIMLVSDGTGSDANISASKNSTTTTGGIFKILRDASTVYNSKILQAGASGNLQIMVPPGAIAHVDAVGAGTYVYKLQAAGLNSGDTVAIGLVKLVAYEL